MIKTFSFLVLFSVISTTLAQNKVVVIPLGDSVSPGFTEDRECAPGMLVEAILADGSLRCKPVVSTDSSCSAGQVVSGVLADGSLSCQNQVSISFYQNTCTTAGCDVSCNAGDSLVGCAAQTDPNDDFR